MITRPRRGDLALIVAALALVAVSLRPWWHDTRTDPASVTPWRASTVWSACIVLVAVAVLTTLALHGRAVRAAAAGVAVGSAAWAVAYTVGLYGTGPQSGGWWTFESSSSPVTIKCYRNPACHTSPRSAFARDDLRVVSGTANPTRSAFAGLTVMVLLALALSWLVWHRLRAQRRGSAG